VPTSLWGADEVILGGWTPVSRCVLLSIMMASLRALGRTRALLSAPRLRQHRNLPLSPACTVRPLSSHAHKRTGDEEKLGDATHEEVNETGVLMTRWFKGLVIGWLGYKFFGIMAGSGVSLPANPYTPCTHTC
jgi:hypothetical protein